MLNFTAFPESIQMETHKTSETVKNTKKTGLNRDVNSLAVLQKNVLFDKFSGEINSWKIYHRWFLDILR